MSEVMAQGQLLPNDRLVSLDAVTRPGRVLVQIVLEEDMDEFQLPAGAKGGLNDWKRAGYGGPCPPVGRHRYFHKLYALDLMLPDLHLPTKAEVEKAMAGHILDSAELVGTYQR